MEDTSPPPAGEPRGTGPGDSGRAGEPSFALVVLAAGLGSRFGGLKQIEPVGPHGETLLDYSVYDALQTGFDRLVFVLRPEMEADFAGTSDRYRRWARVDHVYQRTEIDDASHPRPSRKRRKPWGTAHAVLCAQGVVSTPFAVVNADDFYGRQGFETMHRTLGECRAETEHALVAYRLRDTLSPHGSVSRGVLEVDAAGNLRGVLEHTRVEDAGDGAARSWTSGVARDLSGERWVSMNFWGFKPSVFALLRREFCAFVTASGSDPEAELYLPTVVHHLIAGGEASVKVRLTHGPWYGLTYREDRERVVAGVRELVRKGVYPKDLWNPP